jgi:sugar/nucleoside kinase (ribokinase family)
MTNLSKETKIDVIGVGSPIMDLVALVPEGFLAHAGGQKGGMEMVDAPMISRLVSLLPNLPKVTPGGSAANTIFNANRLGLSTAFVGKLGDDELAQVYRERFASSGVDVSRIKRGSQPNGRCLILTTPDAQRTMRTCLGAAMTLSPDEITPADFAGARLVYIEGYVLFNQALATKIVDAARAAGCAVGLSLASFEVVNASRDWLLQQLKKGIALVLANEDEARTLYPDLPAKTAEDFAAHARRLAETGATAAVTLGKDGAWISAKQELHRIAPVVVSDAIDTNGAGDAWAAGFLYRWLRDCPLNECGAAGSIVAAETVRHAGPIIPDTHWPAVAARVKSA